MTDCNICCERRRQLHNELNEVNENICEAYHKLHHGDGLIKELYDRRQQLHNELNEVNENICEQTMASQHPKEWSEKTHYGRCDDRCGCPCCRAFVTPIVKDDWEHSTCPICFEASREWKKEFWSGMDAMWADLEREMAMKAEAEAEAEAKAKDESQRQMRARRKNWADMMDDELPPLPKTD